MITEVHLISIEDFYSSNQLFFIFQIFSSKVGLISFGEVLYGKCFGYCLQ